MSLQKVDFVMLNDPDICKYYIVGFCPHDMFVNTKADLGACPRAGEEGLVAKCQELVDKAEQLEKQRTAIVERLNSNAPLPAPIDETAIKIMEVCEVCGSMLIKNDAQCRVEEHLSGKMHMGFSKIKVTIEELRERIRKRDEENEKERQKAREEREKR
ncbi:hypothetical protein TELCIR_18550 [Teladorsagia circumcincta]|uniref:LUC7 protein n=1 Tax=Teladorsagia circumcincta TaxID=45464 RepID=A0A2G9TRQ2_TELCI|nr:hypothetical protein TELCIR_18550 [Teladorsagia circumcincta]